jgi:hypothetical protein
MFMMKYGTHSAMQSTSASATAVQIPIAQLLPVPVDFNCKLRSRLRFRLGFQPDLPRHPDSGGMAIAGSMCTRQRHTANHPDCRCALAQRGVQGGSTPRVGVDNVVVCGIAIVGVALTVGELNVVGDPTAVDGVGDRLVPGAGELDVENGALDDCEVEPTLFIGDGVGVRLVLGASELDDDKTLLDGGSVDPVPPKDVAGEPGAGDRPGVVWLDAPPGFDGLGETAGVVGDRRVGLVLIGAPRP